MLLLNHLCEKEIENTIFYLLTFLRPCGKPWINVMQNNLMGASLRCSEKPISAPKMKIKGQVWAPFLSRQIQAESTLRMCNYTCLMPS